MKSTLQKILKAQKQIELMPIFLKQVVSEEILIGLRFIDRVPYFPQLTRNTFKSPVMTPQMSSLDSTKGFFLGIFRNLISKVLFEKKVLK